MRIKDDVLDKWESGWTISEIALEYDCAVEAIIILIGLEGDPFSYELH
jgi:uncharacterized protein (DUF433 family)